MPSLIADQTDISIKIVEVPTYRYLKLATEKIRQIDCNSTFDITCRNTIELLDRMQAENLLPECVQAEVTSWVNQNPEIDLLSLISNAIMAIERTSYEKSVDEKTLIDQMRHKLAILKLHIIE